MKKIMWIDLAEKAKEGGAKIDWLRRRFAVGSDSCIEENRSGGATYWTGYENGRIVGKKLAKELGL